MKLIFVVLLAVGVTSALPLKGQSKNIQNLLTQQNLNTLLQQIQQNQDLYQSLIATYPSQYQLAAQWLASQGFVLPRFGVFDDLDIENLLGSMIQEFLEDFNEIIQQFIQPAVNDIFIFLFSHPNGSPVANSFIGALIQNSLTSSQIIGTNPLENIFQTAVTVLKWITEHPNDVQELTNFFNNYFSVDQFISSLTNTLNSYASNFVNIIHQHLGSFSFQQLFQGVFGDFDFQQFLTPEIVHEILFYCITNLDDAAIPISFLTSLGINYFNVVGQLFAGTFNSEQFLTPEIASAAIEWTVEHPNEIQHLVSFFIGFLPIDPMVSSMINTVSSLFPNLLSEFLG